MSLNRSTKLLLTSPVAAPLGKWDGQQRLVGRLLQRAGGLPESLGDALLEVGADLVLDIFLEPPHDQSLVPEIGWRVVVRITDRSRIQQTHQRGKAAGGTIVRGGREQKHRVRAASEEAGQPGATGEAILMTPRCHIVTLINDDDVPPGILKVVPILEVGLQGVN